MNENRNNEVKEYLGLSELFLKTEMTFKDIYELSILRNKNNLAFLYFDENNKLHSFSYNKVNKLTMKYARKLSTLLKDKNKEYPVILKLYNSPHWCAFLYALIMNGFTPLLVNAKNKKEGTINLIKKTNATAIITDDPFSYPTFKIDPYFIDEVKEDNNFIQNWGRDIILCSSGTTGDIKLVVYNDKNFVYQIMSALDMYKDSVDIMYPKKHGDLKILAMIPFHHIFGFVAIFLWFTFYGKTIVFPFNNNIKEIQDICIKKGITHIFSVPLFFDSIANGFIRKLNQMDENKSSQIKKVMKDRIEGKEISNVILDSFIKKQLLGNKIRFCISGGGNLPKNTSDVINSLGYPLYNGFGMTEIGVTSVELSNDIKERVKCSIGKPFKFLEYKIKDNQLLVKSPAIHYQEFINNIRVNTKLDKDGFFETGDVVNFDCSDGRYYIKGRIKDVIINSDGENVYPDELELYFSHIKCVLKYTIVGVKSSTNKENICFVAQVNSTSNNNDLIKIKEEILNVKNLPNNSCIDTVYFTFKDLPLSNSSKVKRNEIKTAIEKASKEYFIIKNEERNIDNKIVEVNCEISDPLIKIYSSVLSIDQNKLDINSHWIKDLGGDSMLFIELIQQIENMFDIVIPPEKYDNCMTVKNMGLFIQENKK